jgi:hypothetical protein
MMLTRHLVNGNLDSTFGSWGVVFTNFACQGSERINALTAQWLQGSEPRIYAAGSATGNVCN